jgi:hypothetical protein
MQRTSLCEARIYQLETANFRNTWLKSCGLHLPSCTARESSVEPKLDDGDATSEFLKGKSNNQATSEAADELV